MWICALKLFHVTYSIVSKKTKTTLNISHVKIIWTTNELIRIILCRLYIQAYTCSFMSFSFNEQPFFYSHYYLQLGYGYFSLYTPKSDFNPWQLPVVHLKRQPERKFLHTQYVIYLKLLHRRNYMNVDFVATLVNSILNVKRTYS